MAEFVKLKTEEKKLSFTSAEEVKEIEFEIKFKKEDLPPGVSTAYIVIEEDLKTSNPNVVSSKVRLKHTVNLQGPYPDLYLSSKANFHEKGEIMEFVSEVTNLGKKDLQEVKTTFYVNDKEQKEHQLETEKTGLKRKETKLLQASLEKEVFSTGEYDVSVVTEYDDQILEFYQKLVM